MKKLEVKCRFCGRKVLSTISSCSEVDKWFQDDNGYCCDYCHAIYEIALTTLKENIYHFIQDGSKQEDLNNEDAD